MRFMSRQCAWVLCLAIGLSWTTPASIARTITPTFGAVQKAGRGAIPLVLMPCLGCDWRSFDEFMARNESRYTMYGITWPGMGTTALPAVDASHPMPYAVFIREALADLIRKENLGRAVVLGHSAAGPFAVDFAHAYPDLVTKVISVDAEITNKDTLGFSAEQRNAWAEREMNQVLASLDDESKWRDFNTGAGKSLGRRAEFYVQMWLAPPRQNVFAYWRDWLKLDAGRLLPQLRVPLLSIHAIRTRQDPQTVRESTISRYRDNGPASGMCLMFIENSGHTIWEHQPKAFDDAVHQFLTAEKAGGCADIGAGVRPPE